ncbi:ATP synthase subunit d, mitochondrial [Physcomitrium patens]|uniref:Uncharacterized protein n=1 Tax=Physcomitrium patens TaxID=3218 RepID=A9U0M1_PHYPA|nr:ATP synthase subunit d, mitochondrial-like [Physcomitrium patens]PNR28449.1 hypothetical protein PHYPA_029041 [Physcomitrium patens]|eukprot:XP_024363694.1 ATP synthase subunit d, mitochondrial-like [Physcomitrella patens]
MSKGVSKVGRAIDWDYLNKVVVSADGKRHLQALRRAYDDVAITIVDKFSMKPPCINWDLYKEKLGPRIVDVFEKSINSLDKEVPNYECDYTSDYQVTHRKLLIKACEMEAQSKKKIITIDEELARIRDEKEGLATVTVDEYLLNYPALQKKIDDEIRNHSWG